MAMMEETGYFDQDYDPPDETLKVVLENGLTTIELEDTLELFQDDDSSSVCGGNQVDDGDDDDDIYSVDSFISQSTVRRFGLAKLMVQL